MRVTVVMCVCVCVCVRLSVGLSVCSSVTTLSATYVVHMYKMKCRRVLCGGLYHVDFAENALFKSYGVIYLPPLPSTLSDEVIQ